jgi:FAD/FMN-containing dehydrogenase
MYTYIDPSKNNYPGLDRGFNQRYKLDSDLSDSNGEGVYLTYSASDITDVLNLLVEKYTIDEITGKVRIISGGHCYEDFTFQSQTGNANGTRYVIDLSNMRGISEETVDDVTYVTVEPGASNWLIQQTLHSRYAVALPGGSCYSVCAGGHVAGGGYGLLSRLHGLTVDYLAGVEMVISDGAGGFTVRAFDPTDADQLNWACRGGGAGHFGVITKYYFEKNKVPPAPENALLITLPVPWSQFINSDETVDGDAFNQFMQAYYIACQTLVPQAFTLGKFTFMTSADDVMSIVMQVVYGASSGHDAALGGNAVAAITRDEAVKAINDFAAALSPWVSMPQTSVYRGRSFQLIGHPVSATVSLDTIYDLPWIDMTQLLNGSGENQNGKYKSSYIAGNFVLNESTAMAEFLTGTQVNNAVPVGADLSQTLIQIDSYGAQINAMDTDLTPLNTAIAARNSILKTQYQTYWKNYEDTSDPTTRETDIVTWFNAGYNNIHAQAQPLKSAPDNGYPLWGEKFQGCYFNYPDRQIGVNSGYKADPGDAYSGDFCELYFGTDVATKLKAIKAVIDPGNFFAFAQSIPLPEER